MNWDELSFPAQVGVVAAVGVGLLVAFFFIYVQPTQDQIDRLKNDIKQLIEKIDEGKRTSARLNEFKQEVAKLEQRFEIYKEIIPETVEFDNLLKYFASISTDTSTHIKTMKPPKDPTPVDFYATYPIKIEMYGSYHSLINFYLKIKSIKRIINVTDMILERRDIQRGGGRSRGAAASRRSSTKRQRRPSSQQKTEHADKPIQVKFTATTYMFLPPEKRPVPTKGKKGRRRPTSQGAAGRRTH